METKLTALTGIYPLSKTLCFGLKPVGKTLENLHRNGILERDEQLRRDYATMKELVDSYHKSFIREVLTGFKFKQVSEGQQDSLEEYVISAGSAEHSDSLDTDAIRANLRMQVASAFAADTRFEHLFTKKLFKELLPVFAETTEQQRLVREFGEYVTYFTGYNKVRQNLYSAEAKSSSIAYRLVNENLPIFIDNIQAFGRICETSVSESLSVLSSSFSEYLNVERVEELFSLASYSMFLTQEQIDVYNAVIGGMSLPDGSRIQGMNEYINLYNQHSRQRLPLLKKLRKMLLSDRVSLSWIPEKFESDEEMVRALNTAIKSLQHLLDGCGKEDDLRLLLLDLPTFDTEHIYVRTSLLSDFSHCLTGRHDTLTNLIKQDLRNGTRRTPKELREPEEFEARISKALLSNASYSVKYLNTLLGGGNIIESYFSSMGASRHGDGQDINVFTRIELAVAAAADILSGKVCHLNQSPDARAKVKELMDSYKALQKFLEPLCGSGDEAVKDNVFHARFFAAWEELSVITPLYNKVFAWMTRKPYSTESITLNFGSPTLMDGWSVSKEPENRGILLLRDGGYYLGIIDSRAKHAFDAEHVPQDGECYDKMVYRLVSGANKQLPHVFFSAKGVERFNPSDKIMEIYRSGTFKKGKTFSLEDCHALIDYYKTCIEGYEDWNSFDFHFSDTACYADISDFFNEFERQSYLVTFSKVSVSYIDRLVEDGYLYLFRLWHKDFSERSKGVPDLSTLYWRALFDERNIRSTVFKLNGKASILFRRHSIEPGLATVHRANGIIPHKSGQPGESVFAYDIVKDRRFTVDSFLFHASISFNYSARNGGFVNYAVHDLIRAGGVRHILGLHRGEKNLLYYSLIDLNGKIVRQGSLNVVVSENGGVRRETDYRQLLTNRERERDAARRSWQCQQDIKALKAGYLSHIVGTVSSLMVQYDAVAVLEKLDNDFVRSRQAIERNVYRQFEESLIRHLNYHVDKRIGAEEPGGLLRGLQLTNVFESFSKVGFQSGCLFYHPSWKSTRMDPATGFVNMLDTRYVNVSESRIFFSKFDRIEYNSRQDWFEFSFDYGNFGRQLKKSRRQWTVCSHGMCHDTTYDVEKHRWQSSPVVLTTEFRRIFASAGIDVTGNLKDKICQLTEKRFLEPLMHLMGLMLQLCYSSGDGLTDYILSPVQDNNGRFYDSREAPEGMPCDADANAAYNMARRGLASVRSIIASEPGKNVSLGMNNDDWLYFAQHINENDNLIK